MGKSRATQAALRALRTFSASPATACAACRQHPLASSEWPRHEHLCNRALPGFQFATFVGSTNAFMAAAAPLPETSDGNVIAEQATSGKKTVTESPEEITGGNPDLGTNFSSSVPPVLPGEVQEKLNHIVTLIERQSDFLTLLSTNFEEQRQSLNTILEKIEGLRKGSSPATTALPCPDEKGNLDVAHVSARDSRAFDSHPWPEWDRFMNHLRSLPFFREMVRFGEVEGTFSSDLSSYTKRILAKFSQSHEYVFDALTSKHLETLANYGCPNDDRRTVASHKRLKEYFQVSRRVSSPVVASVKPKLADVMRQVYMIVELARQNGAAQNAKLSVLPILEEITALTSIQKHGHTSSSESFSKSETVVRNTLAKKTEDKGFQGASLSDGESFLGSDRWKCPSLPASSMSRSEVEAVAEEDGRLFLPQDLGNEGPVESNRFISAQQKVETCILLDNEEKKDDSGGSVANVEIEDDSDIFKDMFSQNSVLSPRKGPKCSLSELLRQNKEEFSLAPKDRSSSDDWRKGVVHPSDRGGNYDGKDIHGTTWESESKSLKQNRGCQLQARPDQDRGLNQKYWNSSGGRSGNDLAQVCSDNRLQSITHVEQFDTDEDLEIESYTKSSVSSRNGSKSKSRFTKSTSLNDIDEIESGSRGGFERRTKKGGSRSW